MQKAGELPAGMRLGSADGAGVDAGSWKAVHLLSAEEVKELFGDMVEGLAFLVGSACNYHPPFCSLRLALVNCVGE